MHGPSDADTQSSKLVAAQSFLDRTQSVMALKAAAELQPDLPEGKLQVVVDHEDFLRPQSEETGGLADTGSAEVHVGLWFQQLHAPLHGILSMELVLPAGRGIHMVGDDEACVVSGFPVFHSGIAEEDDQFHAPMLSKRDRQS